MANDSDRSALDELYPGLGTDSDLTFLVGATAGASVTMLAAGFTGSVVEPLASELLLVLGAMLATLLFAVVWRYDV